MLRGKCGLVQGGCEWLRGNLEVPFATLYFVDGTRASSAGLMSLTPSTLQGVVTRPSNHRRPSPVPPDCPAGYHTR